MDVFISGGRFVINPEYKANRDSVWWSVNINNSKAYLRTAGVQCLCKALENDDLISYCAYITITLVLANIITPTHINSPEKWYESTEIYLCVWIRI